MARRRVDALQRRALEIEREERLWDLAALLDWRLRERIDVEAQRNVAAIRARGRRLRRRAKRQRRAHLRAKRRAHHRRWLRERRGHEKRTRRRLARRLVAAMSALKALRVEELARRYEEGETLRELADGEEFSYMAVQRRFREAGVRRRERGPRPGLERDERGAPVMAEVCGCGRDYLTLTLEEAAEPCPHRVIRYAR